MDDGLSKLDVRCIWKTSDGEAIFAEYTGLLQINEKGEPSAPVGQVN